MSLRLLDSPEIQSRLRKIKLLALDVDGVLTDGRVFWVEGQGWTRYFHIQDGHGLKVLMNCGIEVAILSGGDSKDVQTRISFLKVKYAYLGDEDKVKALDKIVLATGYSLENIAYMGDELFDIPVIEKVGFSATVPHAVPSVKSRVHYVTEALGGHGAVREVADAIRKAQGLGPYL